MTTNQRLVLIAAILLGTACAGSPKPPELTRLETLRSTPDAAAARRRNPALVAEADGLAKQARASWAAEELDAARRFALLAVIKLKTAITRVAEDRQKVRIEQAQEDLVMSQREHVRLTKELSQLNQEITLLEKLKAERAQGVADRARMTADKA